MSDVACMRNADCWLRINADYDPLIPSPTDASSVWSQDVYVVYAYLFRDMTFKVPREMYEMISKSPFQIIEYN